MTMPADNGSQQLAICTRNDGYPASLEVRKVYRVLPDEDASTHNLIRVIDESGEDYLYPSDYFVLVDVPAAAEELIFAQ